MFQPKVHGCSPTLSDSLPRRYTGTCKKYFKFHTIHTILPYTLIGINEEVTHFKCSRECGFFGLHSPLPNQLLLRNMAACLYSGQQNLQFY